MKKIEMEIECQACEGTGVYVDLDEEGEEIKTGEKIICKKCGKNLTNKK